MNKKSYTSKNDKPTKSVKNMPVVTPSAETETGSRGFIYTGTYRGQPFSKAEENEAQHLHVNKKIKKHNKNTSYEELKDLMINMSDNLDESGEVVLADFGDFLLKKIAQMEEVDYSRQFNLLVKAINNSDIMEKDAKISELTLKFNNIIKSNFETLGNVESKMKAYQDVRKEAERYVG